MRAQLADLRFIDNVLTVTFAQGLELPARAGRRECGGYRGQWPNSGCFRSNAPSKPPPPNRGTPCGCPRWAYPFAAAAMLLIALLAYWGLSATRSEESFTSGFLCP